MKDDLLEPTEIRATPPPPQQGWQPFSKQSLPIAIGIAILSLLFFVPLGHLWRLASNSDLYSHTILIPVVSLYIAWENRNRFFAQSTARLWAVLPLCLGFLLLAIFWTGNFQASSGDALEDYLSVTIGAYVCFAIAIILALASKEAIRANVFAIVFLIFITPFPADVKIAIQTFFQYASAEVSYWLINWSGIPIFRTGLIFEMPTISMEVAPQCSGIRSTLVLFIVSLVGSYFFLQTPWKRALIVFLVIPLGIIRNGIRILVLAQLCYRIGPEEIHGWFHKQGGQPLFVATLIPLFALLYWLWRTEKQPKAS